MHTSQVWVCSQCLRCWVWRRSKQQRRRRKHTHTHNTDTRTRTRTRTRTHTHTHTNTNTHTHTQTDTHPHTLPRYCILERMLGIPRWPLRGIEAEADEVIPPSSGVCHIPWASEGCARVGPRGGCQELGSTDYCWHRGCLEGDRMVGEIPQGVCLCGFACRTLLICVCVCLCVCV